MPIRMTSRAKACTPCQRPKASGRDKEKTDLMRILSRPFLAVPRLVALLACLVSLGMASMSAAQSPFSPARKVNDRVITNYDVEQRMRFLEALNAGGADMRGEALNRLTEEAVQRDLAARRGVRVDRDQIRDGVAEFASRAEMSADEFLTALAGVGVEAQTVTNFVEAGLLWRDLVGQQLPALVSVTSGDVGRARDVAAILGTQRVLLSEIFLPTDPEFADPVRQIVEMIRAARSVEEFSNIAREFSLAGSRDQGGRLPDWVPIENLPPQIGAPLRDARSGQIVGPIELGGAIAFFQVRALESSRDIPPDRVRVSYQRLLLPGGRSEENLARVDEMRARVQNCESFGAYARGLPEQALVAREAFLREIPQSDGVELARLDRKQISANTVEGGNLVVLMLCSRELEFDDAPSDAQLQNIIFERRLDAMANVRLQELIADAEIVDY